MMFRTHLAFGFLVALTFVYLFSPPLPWLFIAIVTFASGLPDIDHPKSTYGRKFPIISKSISFIFKHRGFFHSIFPPLFLFFAFSFFNLTYVGLAILIGYIAHLVGDALTKGGINFLSPLTTFELRGPMKTGAIMETLLFYIIIVINIVYSLKYLGILDIVI